MSAAGVEARPPGPRGPRTRIHLKIVPGGSRDALAGPYGERLRVRVRAPPEGGRANQALLALLAKRLRVARGAITLVRGETAPLKTVEVEGLDAAAVGRLLYG